MNRTPVSFDAQSLADEQARTAIAKLVDAMEDLGPAPCDGCPFARLCADNDAACVDYLTWVSTGRCEESLRAPVPDARYLVDNTSAQPTSGIDHMVLRAQFAEAKATHASDPFVLHAAPIEEFHRDGGKAYYTALIQRYVAWLTKHGAPQLSRGVVLRLLAAHGITVPDRLVRNALRRPGKPPRVFVAKLDTVVPATALTRDRGFKFTPFAGEGDRRQFLIHEARRYYLWLREHGVRVTRAALLTLMRTEGGYHDFTERSARKAMAPKKVDA